MSNRPNKHTGPQWSELPPGSSEVKSSRKKSAKSIRKQHVPQEQELIEQYYSLGINQEFVQSEVGMPPSSFSSFSPDLGGLARMKKIVLELRQELTQLTGRMSLQGEKRFTYHQKLLNLQNQIDRLIRSKEGVVSSLPVVLLDDGMSGNFESLDLDRRIRMLEQRILANELETEKEIASLLDEIKRKDRIIESFNDKVLAEVAASQAFQRCIEKVKDNLYRYQNQIGSLDRLILEGVQFPNVGSYHIREQILARDNLNYSRNRWVSQYRNQLLILFREIQRLHLEPQSVTEIALERIIEGFLMSLQGSRITDIYKNSTTNLRKFKQKLSVVSALILSSITRLRAEYPNVVLHLDHELVQTIQNQNISISRIENGVVFVDRVEQVLIEVPIIEQRNIMVAPTEVVDIHLSESFGQETGRLKNTVFHLRVLIKALLSELDQIKLRTGYPLEIDERVIAMINQQAGGIIDVEDVLRVFQLRAPQEHVIIESQPERIVEVPQVVIVDKIVEKIVEVERIREVEKVVNVPIEVPYVVENIIEKIVPVQRIVERIVQVPVQVEKLIEIRVEVPKVVEVEVERVVTVPVDNVIEVEKNIHHVVPQPQQIQVIIEKIVPVETIIQKIIEVPTIIEKIVEKVIRVPEIIEIEVIVERLVKEIEYVIQPQQTPYIQVEHKIVERVVQKLIPVMQIEERIVEVPQVIEKIVEVRTIHEVLKEVEVIREKFVVQDRIKEVEVIVQEIVPMIKEVEKVVEKRVEIPIIVEKLVVVPEIINKPIIERVVETVIQEIRVEVPVVIKETEILEVEKLVNCFIEVPNVVKVYEDRIIQVPVYVDRIKEVRVQVEKIIEKLVQVPKVVEVEKIVQKIVVVPRVIESIKQIPQITEVVVDRVIVEKQLVQIERIVQIPTIQQSIREVEVIKNIYIPVQKLVQMVVEKLVECPVYQQKIINHQVIQEKIVEIIREIPVEIEVPQIITNFIEKEKVVEIERNVIIPVEVPVYVEAVVEKIVPIYELKETLIQVPQMIQKIVEIKVQDAVVHEVESVTNNVVIDTQIVSVPERRVVVEKQYQSFPLVVEKIIPVNTVVDNIVPREYIVEKVVQTTIEIPKVYEIEKNIEKVVHIPKVMEIEKFVPQIVRVNQIIERTEEKVVEVPVVIQQLIEIEVEREKIVAVNTIQQQIIEVDRYIEKPIIMEKMKEVVRDIHHIEQQLKIVDRLESVPVPIVSREEKILEVPQILEKIVERIVIMPQVKEVLKYVHEISEVESLGVAVSGDVSIQEINYKLLLGNLRDSINIIIQEFKRLMISQPHMQGHIQMLFSLLTELDKLNRFSRVVPVPFEKIVEKEVEVKQVVRVPFQDEASLRKQVSLAILTEKLVAELTRIRNNYPNVQLELEDDIKLIFLPQLQMPSSNMLPDFNQKLMQFQGFVTRKFQSLGNWTTDHQLILNSFLEQRFVMANLLKQTNTETEKIRMIAEKRLEGLRRYKTSKNNYEIVINQLIQILPQLIASLSRVPDTSRYILKLEEIARKVSEVERTGGFIYNEPVKTLEDLKITDERTLSLLRQKEYEIFTLRQKLASIQKHRSTAVMDPNIFTINQLSREVQTLKNINADLKNQIAFNSQNNLHIKLKNLNEKILSLEIQKADLQSEVFNLRNQLETHMNFASAEIEQYKIRLSNSGITTVPNTSPRRFNPNMGSSLHSPPYVQSNFSSRYVTDSLAISASPHNSHIPPIFPSSSYPTILATQSVTMSSQRSPPNNQIVYHQESFTTRDNRMFSPTIPEVAYSSISNQEYRRDVNHHHQPERELHSSDQTKSISVPGVNYDIPAIPIAPFPPLVPSQPSLNNGTSLEDSAMNQPIISTQYHTGYSQQEIQQPMNLPNQDSDLHSQQQNLQYTPYTHPSPLTQPSHTINFSQSLPEAPHAARNHPLATSEYNMESITTNLLQSNVGPLTVVSSRENIVLPSHTNSFESPHNAYRTEQLQYQLPIYEASSINQEGNHLQQHLEYEPNIQLHSNTSMEDRVEQQEQYQEQHQAELESLPELHQTSEPIIHQTHSEEHLPWPQSPNYDGLEQLSRGSEYSAYSGYSSRKSHQE